MISFFQLRDYKTPHLHPLVQTHLLGDDNKVTIVQLEKGRNAENLWQYLFYVKINPNPMNLLISGRQKGARQTVFLLLTYNAHFPPNIY